VPARPPRRHLPAHQDLEGVPGPRARRQARPHRRGSGVVPRPGFHVRRVRAARHPPHRWLRLGPGGHPERHPVTYHRTHGVRYFHGCYSIGDDTLWGVNRRKKGATNTLAALRSVRAARPDVGPIYVIMDNLSAHQGETIRRWARKNRVEICFTPTYASWANPIEVHFGPLRQFTVANSNHRNHTVQTRALHACLRWRNQNTRHRDVLTAQRRERARIRSGKGSASSPCCGRAAAGWLSEENSPVRRSRLRSLRDARVVDRVEGMQGRSRPCRMRSTRRSRPGERRRPQCEGTSVKAEPALLAVGKSQAGCCTFVLHNESGAVSDLSDTAPDLGRGGGI
jgi:DDE superfamily endonuclease